MTTSPGTRPRVLLLHNFLTPYRVPLFTELAQRVDLEVWILGDVRKIREWPADAPQDAFRYQCLPHIGLPMGSRDYRVLLNYTLPVRLPKHRCDVIVCAGWDTPAAFYSAYWARTAGRPWVLWSGSTLGEPNWRRTLTRPLVGDLVRHASAWIAYGSRAQEYLETLGADTSRIFRAYNTVETDRFAEASRISEEERDRFKSELGFACRNVILYCGQLIKRKGLSDLLDGFAEFARDRDDLALVVVGSGGREAVFRAQSQALGIGGKVHFVGFVPRDALPRYYAIADLFALPSREEVWGLVLNEALACGVPVLTTNAAGAAPDLVRDGVNGYIAAPAAPSAIREALERHFGPDTDRARMREAARESIRPFTLARAAEAMEAAVRCAWEGSGR